MLIFILKEPRFVSDYIWVDNDRKLQTARKESRQTRRIGIDTEYDSFRYFREKLCLIQIKTEDRTFLFDPLSNLDLTFLGEAFSNPAVPKIVHAGDNDVRLLKRDYGFRFANIFDTQRAAMLLGCKYLALTAVIQQVLGIEVSKTKHIQRSQWETRPLSAEQMEYAVQDIDYLFPLYEKLRAELAANGLREKAEEAFREIVDTWVHAARKSPNKAAWKAVVKAYLSPEHCEHPESGCPVAALAPELARVDKRMRPQIVAELAKYKSQMQPFMPGRRAEDKERAFFAIFSTILGAVELARLLPDPAMREKVLASARDFLLRSF